jgi:hypothetical protein
MISEVLQRLLDDMNKQSWWKRFKRHWKVEFEVLRLLGFKEWIKHLKWKNIFSNYKI